MTDKERAAWRALLAYVEESHSDGLTIDTKKQFINAVGELLKDDEQSLDEQHVPWTNPRWSDWIEWHGGENPPIPDGVRVEVRFRGLDNFICNDASTLDWRDSGYAGDIVAYRYRLDQMPRVDRSLRGPVVVKGAVGEWLRYATVRGLSDCSLWWANGSLWKDVEAEGYTVRKLTPEDIGYKVRRWDEWTQDERDGYRYVTEVRHASTPTRVDAAIDIATRGTHE